MSSKVVELRSRNNSRGPRTGSSMLDEASAYSQILEKIGPLIPNGAGALARCPAHEDPGTALVLSPDRDRPVTLRCQKGCSKEVILKGLGLTTADLGEDEPLKAEALIESAQMPEYLGRFDYCDSNGTLLYRAIRTRSPGFWHGRPDDNGGWIEWHVLGAEYVLFNLRAVLAAIPEEPVFFVECEFDVDLLTRWGLIATTSPQGVGHWRPECVEALRSKRVVIIPNNDNPGRWHARKIMGSLQGAAAEVTMLEPPGLDTGGSITDWIGYCGGPEEFIAVACGRHP